MKNYRLWLVVFILLVVVNCGVLTMVWLRTQRHPQGRPGGDAKAYLIKELKLNAEQTKQYEAMARQHFEFTSRVNQESRDLHDEFFDGLKNPNTTPAQTDAIEKQITEHQMMLDTATFNHFKKLRSILNTAQQAHFDEIIQNVLHMMGGPHPGGRPREDRPPQPNAVPGNPPPQDKAPVKGERKNLPPCDPRPGPPPPGARPGPDGRPPYGPPPEGPPPDGPPPA